MNRNKMNASGKVRERVPTGRRGRPSKSMIAAAMERPFCSYLHKVCLNNRLESHKYCIDHILNDKTAQYRQCTFVHLVTGRRCPRAAHKVDRKASPLCQYHRAVKLNSPHQSQVQLAEMGSDSKSGSEKALKEDLAHYRPIMPDQARPQSSNTFWLQLENGAAVPSTKLAKILATYNVKRLTQDLEPVEMPTAEEMAVRHYNADSDCESVDYSYDLNKSASVYTEEEVLRTLRDKMIRLRRLHIEQYSHIQYTLKEKRLKYIQAQRQEDEMFGEIYSFRNYPDSPDYKMLKAMLRYHKTFGPDSLLQDQAKKRKQNRPPTVGPHLHPSPNLQAHSHDNKLDQLAASSARDTSKLVSLTLQSPISASPTTNTTSTNDFQRTVDGEVRNFHEGLSDTTGPSNNCIFSKTPQGCDRQTLPLSPYCRQHILYDKRQVLFRPCAGGLPPCLTPVMSFTRKNKCSLHTGIN